MGFGRNKESKPPTGGPAYGVAGVLVAVALASVAAPRPVHAEGLFEMLFGGFQRQSAPPVTSYAEPPPPSLVAPDPSRRGGVIGGSGGNGRLVGYCVRLCDGQHFPLDHNANATPVEICRSMCPTAKTKVFFGNEIDHAVARDGARYADLDNAYVYREHFVSNCTCNGKDAFGLTKIDAKNDPTLRAGDIVTTAGGPMAFAGKRGQVAEFTPVDPAALVAPAGSARLRLSQRATEPPPADDEPGVIVTGQLPALQASPQPVQPPVLGEDAAANQADR
jgi:hypothetical protein